MHPAAPAAPPAEPPPTAQPAPTAAPADLAPEGHGEEPAGLPPALDRLLWAAVAEDGGDAVLAYRFTPRESARRKTLLLRREAGTLTDCEATELHALEGAALFGGLLASTIRQKRAGRGPG